MCNCGGLEIVIESPAPVKTGWSICLSIHDTWVQTHAYHPAPVKPVGEGALNNAVWPINYLVKNVPTKHET
jgi:hypothetical protein